MAFELTKENFEEVVLTTKEPVLVDFSATWCGPCKMLSPIVEELAQELAGDALICKVDIDQQPEIAQALGIMSVPTVVVFREGQVAGHNVGFAPKAKLLNMLGR